MKYLYYLGLLLFFGRGLFAADGDADELFLPNLSQVPGTRETLEATRAEANSSYRRSRIRTASAFLLLNNSMTVLPKSNFRRGWCPECWDTRPDRSE